jgi:light-regulated signal transduction histidine kinase (bacteriophytochrome)
VDGYAQILEEFGQQLPSEALNYVRKIRQGSRNMTRLVDDLLNLSRIGKQEMYRAPASLTHLAEAALAEIKLETASRRIEWQLNELPTLDCDAGLVKQVFINLFSNAAKYTRPRELARIEIGQMAGDGQTIIYVKDNGVGFDMKYAGKLFGVFQRLHQAEDFEGSGAGLAITQFIIRRHGGRIWAEAAPNQGATFYFTLGPLVIQPAAIQPADANHSNSNIQAISA